MKSFDVPADPAFWQDPAPFYQAPLAAGGGLFAISSGGYSVVGYNALYELGRDPRVEGHPFPEAGFGPELTDLYDLMRFGLFALGAPDHKPLRQAAIAGLSTVKADAIRHEATTIAETLAGDLKRNGGGDLIADFARPLASQIFCHMTGLDRRLAGEVAEAVEAIMSQLNGEPDKQNAANDAAKWLMARLTEGFATGQSPLMSAMAQQLEEEDSANAVQLTGSFIVDAVDMVVSGLFATLDFLIRHDAAIAALQRGDNAIKDVVQEAYRITTPATLTSRVAREDIVWRGQKIAKDSALIMWWGTGNLDPQAFENPLLFKPDRENKRHLAFGVGGHACIGRLIASVVTEVSVTALLINPDRQFRSVGEVAFLPRLARIAQSAPIALL
jgi:cytochrome P450